MSCRSFIKFNQSIVEVSAKQILDWIFVSKTFILQWSKVGWCVLVFGMYLTKMSSACSSSVPQSVG